MNRYARAVLTIVLVLGCASIIFAQEGGEGGKKKRGYQHQADIITQYDSKKDETKVELKRMNVQVVMQPREHILHLTVYYTYPGKTPSKPQEIVIGFVSASHNRERKFQDVNELTAELDSEKISFGPAEMLESRIMGSYYKEVLGLYSPFDKFFHLVDNKKETLEMRLGNIKFELRRFHLEALRDLASRIQP